jgi:hypothetical protein
LVYIRIKQFRPHYVDFFSVPGYANNRGYRKNWGIEPGNVAKKDKNLTTEV